MFRLRFFKKWLSFVFILVFLLLLTLYITYLVVNRLPLIFLSEISCNEVNKNCNCFPKENDKGNSLTTRQALQVWIKIKKKNSSKHFKHIVNSFRAFNSEISQLAASEKPENDWNILWSHDYPFRELRQHLLNIKTPHCINHFPGTGFITNKVTLASSGIHTIPKAFQIPEEKSKLLKYAQENPNARFVQKSSNHRGIKIEKVETLDFTKNGSFVQYFVHNPLLVDGYKFDLGVYTILTSVDPLRVYIYDDILFRFCKEKYHPFIASELKKYVVADHYRPMWEIPSLENYYKAQGIGMKLSFNTWLKGQGKDPSLVWRKVQESIRNVFYMSEHHIIPHLKTYSEHLKFFEVMRFDFIVDEELNVYLMEANMSPNLSSAHTPENRLLYEQVVFNLLSLVGLSYGQCTSPLSHEQEEMRGSQRDIAVFPEHCATQCRERGHCAELHCQLCQLCLTVKNAKTLRAALLEHIWRGSYRRVIPKPLDQEEANLPTKSENLSPSNTLMAEWFRGKCLLDSSFCS